MIAPHEEAAEYARTSFTPGRPLLDAVADLSAHIHAEFQYRPNATQIDTPLDEVLRERHGVCQDFAHLALAGLRGLGLAARYVSGCLETAPPAGMPRQLGADASHAWIGDWLPRLVAAEVPNLGICFGHQMLAEAMGGRVDFHPKGREIGCVDLHLHPDSAEDPLFHELPRQFPALAVHAQSVRILPPHAILLAGNDFEPHHAFRIGTRAWGIQFHPEFDRQRMAAYVHHLAPQLHAAGQDCDRIRAKLCDTPIAATLLPRFAAMVHTRFT